MALIYEPTLILNYAEVFYADSDSQLVNMVVSRV
jgi:hypothetical protein